MHYRRLRIDGATYFFTVVSHDRRPIFADPVNVRLLNECMAKVREGHPFEIEAQVVLPDHLHTMWTMPDGDANFSTRWRLIKETFTRRNVELANIVLGTDRTRSRVWQNRFWEHLIRDDRDFSNHVDYIHLNPVHHGFVKAPRDWPHSTFTQWVARGTYDPLWGSDEKPELPAWAKRHE